MAARDSKTCPVCGFLWSEAIDAFDICDCCGTEFCLDDRTKTHAQLRKEWVKGGMRWWAQDIVPPPPGWNPVAQLNRMKR